MENQILLEKIGETKSNKLIDDCYKIYKEKFQKCYPEYFEKNSSKCLSIVTALENNQVMNIGMSKVDDLLSDNWGKFLGSIISQLPITISLQDITDTTQSVPIYGSSTSVFNNIDSGSLGTLISVGSGSTPATRSDFNIETLLQTLVSNDGGWNSALGKIQAPAASISTFTNTITETVLISRWVRSVATVSDFLLSRDNISPGVPVTIGQTINVDYNILLS